MNQSRDPAVNGHDDQLVELAAGFSVGALGERDAARFTAHLSTCPRCVQLVREYRAALTVLPHALEPIEGSPGLRDRVLAQARADRHAEAITPRDDARPTVRTVWYRGAMSWALPLAALLLMVVGLGYWNLQLRHQLATQTAELDTHRRALQAVAEGGQQWTLAGTDRAPRAGGLVVQPPSSDLPLVLLHDLPELPADRVYQAWVISGSVPQPAGVLTPGRGGAQVAQLDRPLTGAQTVAITIEPVGGSPSPTGPIVVAGEV